MQNAELIQFDRHLKKTAAIFANCACLKLACAAGKRYSAHNGGVEQDEPPMDGVMPEGYEQRFGERLRVENAHAMVTRVLSSASCCPRKSCAMAGCRYPMWPQSAASPIKVISRACSTGSLA
jgi:hypothetical protein